MKVLIFEDEPILRLALESRLEDQGYKTMSFGRPSEAMAAIEESDSFPDLALLDITLDVIPSNLIKIEQEHGFYRENAGIELAKRICGIKKIPLIFLTGNPSLFDDAAKVGPHSFISKSDRSPDDSAVTNAIRLALDNFYNAPDYKPYFQLLPKGKICLNTRSNTQDSDTFRRIVIQIDDILYFRTQQESTKLFVKGYDHYLRPTVSAKQIMRNMEQILNEKNIENSFHNVSNGCYANTNNIVSYDSLSAYFDVDSKIFCPLNNYAYQHMLKKFAPITN